MKMYRSINCQVTVVLNMDKEASERLKREENYSFSVLSAIETAVELPAAVHDLSSNGDRIVLIQGDSILLNNAPENEEERFHIKRMVTSLLK